MKAPSSPLRRGAAWILLLLQLLGAAHARFVSTRYGTWAPFNSETRYRLDVTVGGIPLPGDGVTQRYGLSPFLWDATRNVHWELNRVEHVQDAVRATEAVLGDAGADSVRMTFVTNGGRVQDWKLR